MIGTRYVCGGQERRALVRAGRPVLVSSGHVMVNGIDFLEVVDAEAPPLGGDPDALRQRLLLVRCFWPVPSDLYAGQVRIDGGVRVRDVRVDGARALVDVAASPDAAFAPIGAWLVATRDAIAADPTDDPSRYLIVLVGRRGDFSEYALTLQAEPSATGPPEGFDPRLATVAFSFKAACPSDFDCAPQAPEPPPGPPSPRLDHRARDFASVRRLMLDRMATTMPGWTERSPADLGVALVEVLAWAADQLAYEQDAVATEATLGTARRRVSVRRHARLLDYTVDEGAAARALVRFEVTDGQVISGTAEAPAVPVGTPLWTRVPALAVVTTDEARELRPHAPTVFETARPLRVLTSAHNTIRLHTWGDARCCLAAGATSATLVDGETPETKLRLEPGDVLIFEEVVGVATRRPEDADPERRHAVVLTEPPAEGLDVVTGTPVLEVRWGQEDALPFELCLHQVVLEGVEPETVAPASVARGNVVLADHGETRFTTGHPAAPPAARIEGSLLPRAVTRERHHAARLSEPDLTWQAPVDPAASAAEMMAPPVGSAGPSIALLDDTGHVWSPVADLLATAPTRREFAVEMDDRRRAWLRFGDGVLGRPPQGELHARYRVGTGPAGNVGAGSLVHVVSDDLAGAVTAVTNPLPARGGRAPEASEHVRQHAPSAFREQRRAVTVEDWVRATEQHPDVQRAVARIRWTGSWYTVFVAVDRRGGRPVDAAFEAELWAFLEPFRLAGFDLEVEPPIFVDLDVALTICVAAGFDAAEVEERLLVALSAGTLASGRPAFFHPDRRSFGDHVFLSELVATAMGVPGVAYVDAAPPGPASDVEHRFKPLHEVATDQLREGRIFIGPDQIARLDNDPNAPEHGRLELYMRGGL